MAGIRVTVRARARNGCSFGPAHPRPKAVAEMALADRPPVRQLSPGSAVPKAERRTRQADSNCSAPGHIKKNAEPLCFVPIYCRSTCPCSLRSARVDLDWPISLSVLADTSVRSARADLDPHKHAQSYGPLLSQVRGGWERAPLPTRHPRESADP